MGVIKMFGLAFVVSVAGASCTKTVNECSSDSDCKDVAYPFCDVKGEFGPSGGAKNVCTIIPPECPIERCGCSPGATTCTGSTLNVCNMDGKGTTATACSLGCASSMNRCLAFTPLNGLGSALLAAPTKGPIVLPSMVSIDTDTGIVKDGSGAAITFDSIVLTQQGSPDIRAYTARSIDMTNAVVTGAKALALVASGDVTVRGTLDLSANGVSAGPGAMETGSCGGAVDTTGGGAGNGTDGAAGASSSSISGPTPGGAGGKSVMSFEPLFGGCRGGAAGGSGGAGGGALQIVSGTKASVDSAALVDAGGGGPTSDATGGGAGGTIILEAPVVAINGTVVANGAAGGACGVTAADGTRTAASAVGASCGAGNAVRHGGSGGTRTMLPTGGFTFVGVGNAGGGGAVGRVLVRTMDGTYAAGGSSLISAVVLTQQLQLQ